MSRVATILDELRSRIEILSRELRLAPLDQREPLPWQSDPAIQALADLDEAEQLEAATALLDEEAPVLQAIGVHVITVGQLRALLPRALELPDSPLVNTFQLGAIGRLGAREHVDRVIAALGVYPSLFWSAVEAMALLGGEGALEHLRRASFTPPDPWDRLDVLSTVNSVNEDLAIPLLIEALRDTERFDTARGFAAQALGHTRRSEALGPLLEALSDPTFREKGRALWGLAQLEEPRVFDAVQPFLEEADKDWWRGEALKAAAASEPDAARPLVLAAAEATGDPYYRKDLEAFGDIIHALGQVGGDVARDHLLDLLEASLGGEPASNWPIPEFVKEGGLRLAVSVLAALERCLGAELFDMHNTPGFRYPKLVERLLARLVEETHERPYGPRVEAMLDRHRAEHDLR